MTSPRRTPTTEPDGHRRLPRGIRPLRYALDMTLDPGAARFTGRVVIDLDVESDASEIHLHADQLELHETTVSWHGQHRSARTRAGRNGALVVTPEVPVPRGPAQLHLRWSGPLNEVPEGLYFVRHDGARYLYSQFEPLAARRAFPAFDEPAFKARFAVTLRVPRGNLALANGPVERVSQGPDHDVHVFRETPPLATYLVGFAVGPFDVVSAPAGAAEIPLRVVTTRGNGHLAQFALTRTPPILAALSAWFGQLYPYDKLDLVGVPNFAAGAMENVGLVTFRERLVLLDLESAPAVDRLWAQVVIAHELAHMWFGNLVTMRWWDDLWLNEAFATWMETRIVAAVDPELDVDLEAVREAGRVMDTDALTEARAIRQPVGDGGDVLNAFDGITYSKGTAVVRMIEAWIGEASFQTGVRAYLRAHAHGNADTRDLLRALDVASGQPVSETLRGFLDQPGTPLVEVEIHADPPAVTLHQRRYRPSGGEAPEGSPWRIPVTLRYGRDGAEARTEVLLGSAQAKFALELDPAWLHPNGDETGYYRWRLPDAALRAITGPARAHLSPPERVALPAHLWALLESGDLDAELFLDAISDLAADPHRLVVEGVIDGLRRLDRVAVEGADRAPFAAFVRGVLGPHAARIGLVPRKREPAGHRLLRTPLLMALAGAGRDVKVIAVLEAEADAFLADVAGGDAEVGQCALPVSAWRGDAERFERVLRALPDAPTPAHRGVLIRALGSFADPALARRACDVFLTDTLRAQDLFTLLAPMQRRRAPQVAMWRWLDQYFVQVLEKVGEEVVASLPALSGGFNDQAGADEVTAFFAPPERQKPGLARNLAQALEGIGRRQRLRAAAVVPVQRFLARDARANP